MQGKINNFKTQEATDDYIEIDEELSDDETDDDYDESEWQVGKKLKFDMKDLRLDEWLEDLESDRQSLINLYNNATAINTDRDAKLLELKNRIIDKVRIPINTGNRKVLVFTAYSDTAIYLFNSLRDFASDNLINIALVTGTKTDTTFGINDFEHILTNFSPVSKNRKETDGEIDLLIATDCLSEGQNLQDCDTVINYDIHWNPIRIIQRFGRIDRLKSKNDSIQLMNFWPTKDLDKYIDLKARVEARMALSNLTATGDYDPLDNPDLQVTVKEGELRFREKQLLRLKDEVLDIEELDDSITLTDFTLEDFRIELLAYLENNREKLENTPLGMYAVAPNAADNPDIEYGEAEKDLIKPGVIYCLKQQNSSDKGDKINPVAPYFLVYIRQDGTVRYNYTNIRQILDIYRKLCHGVKEPYQDLCDLFNRETNDGKDMETYAGLLQKAINEITAVHRKRSIAKLSTSRNAVIAPIENQIRDESSFELVTWLVIK